MSIITIKEAIARAMERAMRSDETVFLAGEDVAELGGAFGCSRNFVEEFGPNRCFNTPISETAIIGLGIGSALAGMRPIVELMYMDFMGVCMDEIMNQTAKMRYMFGGKARLPLVIRMAVGATVRAAGQHSQSLEAMICHIPGLKVVYPSTPQDAFSILTSAIEDENPVVCLEHKAIYSNEGMVDENKRIPIGCADVIKEGKDATIVAWGLMARRAEKAAEELEKEKIYVEVIDPRTLVPLDKDTIFESVKKTGKLIIAQEAVHTCGFASEISASVAENCIEYLDAPILRVTAPDTPIPYSPVLEDAYVPSVEKIVQAVKTVL